MPTPKYLVRSDNGRIFAYTPQLASLPTMMESMDLEEAQMLSRKRGGNPTASRGPDPEPNDTPANEGQGENDEFVISKANKDELEAFAKEQFDVDLDKRKKVDDLRAEVMELVQANEG
ncbi:hypothetical protein V5738_10875 [Salinisphaera sp. SPP-AMP-43]|uniref:hypothetical protein n=1 Tax=Salinisphaera sp. SPP-AMP-43 TaxID=3121288 RepID=UPI003C6E04FB